MKDKLHGLTPAKRRKKFTSYDWQMWSFWILPLILIFIFAYLPMGGIIIAFKNYKYNLGIFGSEWVGFDNFKFFFASDTFLKITWNTLSMNFMFRVVGTISSVLIAILLYEVRSRMATKVFQTVLITPYFISWVIVAYMVFALLNTQYGIVNVMRERFGLEGIDWYSEPKYWPFILIVSNVWKGIGMDSVLYYAALMGVDEALFEAAEIDGANKVKIIWHIILPMLVPTIVILNILAIGSIFRADFGLFYNVPRNVGLLYDKTDVIDTFIFRTMRQVGDMGMSSAVGLLQSCVGLVLVLLTNYVTNRINSDLALF